ncbi:MAG: D-alanine--D-alanine ligase [Ignavibacteriales bacterium]|jgi:D-alanine-D-alanine ligase|nr:D-alanine--D-alanine ligase [Ignavibacteriaceae bacterium]NLH61643.1 D-alanine--D-alanine ligase [Ignavibacteriales bacterium]HOJ18808.1 D-alanine--D-alanine ligase [Ignavibacteriaceae bacterium]HPO55659.1 D-alanine--D-alanine ligase [Ignavibacteriaceae bacterium]
MKEDLKILIAYNAPVSLYSLYSGKETGNQPKDLSESSFFNELELIKESLEPYYSCIELLAVDKDIFTLMEKLRKIQPDVIVNFVESVEGISSFESYITGLYELLNIPYTGNGPLALNNCLDKARAKEFLIADGIKTPGYYVYKYKKSNPLNNFNLSFPVISKLAKEDASIGISENSVSFNKPDLLQQLDFLTSTYKQDIIIEEFIDGREFNIAILGNSPLPVSEICFTSLPGNLPKIVTYEGKWIADTVYYKSTIPCCPAIIDLNTTSLLQDTAIKAFHSLNCRDYARVDIRLSHDGIPFVIEVNPNPDITSDSGFNRAACALGMDYGMMLKKIITLSLERHLYDTTNKRI